MIRNIVAALLFALGMGLAAGSHSLDAGLLVGGVCLALVALVFVFDPDVKG